MLIPRAGGVHETHQPPPMGFAAPRLRRTQRSHLLNPSYSKYVAKVDLPSYRSATD
jgi:hypothetical protein